MKTSELEYRVIPSKCEVRARGEQTAQIVGYAAVFNSRSQNLGGFVEQIAPGAFNKTLQEADVRALVNHDPNWVIGRSTVGSLRMESDGTGLRYEVDVSLADPDGKRAVEKVAAGLIDGSSFGFRVIDEEWGLTEDDFPLRTLKEVALRDVGPATFPAYLDTSIASRALTGLAAQHETDPQALAEVPAEIRSLIQGETKPPAEGASETSGEETEEPEMNSTPGLAIARRRLELLARRPQGAGRNPHPS